MGPVVAAVRTPVPLLAPAAAVPHRATPGAPLVDLVPAGQLAAGVGAGEVRGASFFPMICDLNDTSRGVDLTTTLLNPPRSPSPSLTLTVARGQRSSVGEHGCLRVCWHVLFLLTEVAGKWEEIPRSWPLERRACDRPWLAASPLAGQKKGVIGVASGAALDHDGFVVSDSGNLRDVGCRQQRAARPVGGLGCRHPRPDPGHLQLQLGVSGLTTNPHPISVFTKNRY